MKNTAQKLVTLLRERKLTITTAESCTGGLVSAAITAIPGASAVLEGAIVTYSPSVKARFLSIDPQALEGEGVVSAYTATHMAEGARALMNADCAIALTGYAGPDGGDAVDPVGTVYIAAATERQTCHRRLSLEGDRDEIRASAAKGAMELLLELLETV